MSVYAVLDEGSDGGTQVATNSGWGDFTTWTESLDDMKYEEVIHLAEEGWSQDLADLESQLTDALTETPPSDADTLDVARWILQVATYRGDAEVLLITQGFGTVGKMDDEEDDIENDAEDENESPDEPQEAARAIWTEQIRSLVRWECDAVTRAAKKPQTFLSECESFIYEHQQRMTDKLSAAERMCRAVGVEVSATVFAAEHRAEVWSKILKASEVSAAELQVHVEAMCVALKEQHNGN